VRLAVAALAVLATLPPPAAQAGRAPDRVLVFTRTEGFRHASIAPGVRLVRASGLRVTRTEDPRWFTDRRLRAFRAVVFLSATGDVLDRPQERALERYVRAGGGWLGIHGAADAPSAWAFHRDVLLGTEFIGHPPTQRATIVVEDADHPATRGLPRRWTRVDEWYSFRPSPRAPGVRVLARLDESTYDPGRLRMGADHPVVWSRTAGRGRVLYTALGHTTGSYAEPAFRRHVLGALRWVRGSARARR
jgi:type 1 glutamine amidotransferase